MLSENTAKRLQRKRYSGLASHKLLTILAGLSLWLNLFWIVTRSILKSPRLKPKLQIRFRVRYLALSWFSTTYSVFDF